jgi:hypothetical protein
LHPGATQEQVKNTFSKQKDFWSDGSSHPSVIKLATAMDPTLDQAYALLSSPPTAGTSSGSTTSNTTGEGEFPDKVSVSLYNCKFTN